MGENKKYLHFFPRVCIYILCSCNVINTSLLEANKLLLMCMLVWFSKKNSSSSCATLEMCQDGIEQIKKRLYIITYSQSSHPIPLLKWNKGEIEIEYGLKTKVSCYQNPFST